MNERWHDIPGYEGIYQVSTRGRVRSLPRIDASGNRRRGQVLRGSGRKPRAYYQLCRNGRTRLFCASALMALVHGIPNPARYRHVIHVDSDPGNFRRTNLRWATLAQLRLHEGRKKDAPYHGVIRNKRRYSGRYPWILQLREGKQRKIWRVYATAREAAYAWNEEVRRRGLNRPLNDVRRPRIRRPPAIKALPGERWRPFPGTVGTHSISNLGRIRTLAYITTDGKRISARLRKITTTARGHRSILIWGRRYTIAKILARVFGNSTLSR